MAGWLLLGTGLLLGAMIAHAAFGLGGPGSQTLFVNWLYNIVLVSSAGACLLRGLTNRRERLSWTILGASLMVWAAGNIYYTLFLIDAKQVPIPSPSDIAWLGFYPAAYLSIGLLVRSRVTDFRTSLWLDGVIGALTVSAAGVALILRPVLSATGGAPLSVAVALAYPMLDLTLVALVVGILAVVGWRPGRTWALVALGFAVFGLADGVYAYQNALGQFQPGGLLDVGWPTAIYILALAAWQRPGERRAAPLTGRALLAMPVMFAAASLGLLFYGTAHHIEFTARVLAGAALLFVIIRMAISFRENAAMLHVSRNEALTDSLTGLGNRRQLIGDLEAAYGAEEPFDGALALFDLNGFKLYNDTFGHPAGDALLARLGRSLSDAANEHGTAYRMGGDEFCVLAAHADDAAVSAWNEALSEQGDGFTISASYGAIRVPADAATAREALKRADQAMYANKYQQRTSAGRQSMDVLVAVMAAYQPMLGEHGKQVAALAEAVARGLELPKEEVEAIRWAGELHEVGKIAVPAAILSKAGPLDLAEQAFVNGHPLVGERIIAHSPALRHVAEIVRCSHERIDGSGYPCGLAGAAIPTGARIIAACDAYCELLAGDAATPPVDHRVAAAALQAEAGSTLDARAVELLVEYKAASYAARRP